MRKIAFSILILAVFSMSIYAAAWSDDLTIEQIHVESVSNLIVVKTSGGTVYTSGCRSNRWQITTNDDALQNRVYSMLLTAYTTEQTVEFWYTDQCGSWDYHEATAARIGN